MTCSHSNKSKEGFHCNNYIYIKIGKERKIEKLLNSHFFFLIYNRDKNAATDDTVPKDGSDSPDTN